MTQVKKKNKIKYASPQVPDVFIRFGDLNIIEHTLLNLIFSRQGTGYARSLKQLKKDLGVGENKLSRALERLQFFGVIYKKSGYIKGDKKVTNTYFPVNNPENWRLTREMKFELDKVNKRMGLEIVELKYPVFNDLDHFNRTFLKTKAKEDKMHFFTQAEKEKYNSKAEDNKKDASFLLKLDRDELPLRICPSEFNISEEVETHLILNNYYFSEAENSFIPEPE